MEEVSPELVEKLKIKFGLNLDEEVVDDEEWEEVAFEASPSMERVVEKLGIHLPAGRKQVQIASINISAAKS